jgi:hypothetical protein
MRKMKEKSNIWTQLQGQAGVWTVAAQLAIRGHVPMFPGVDYGFDLAMENGLRLQIKTARLTCSRKRGVDYPRYSFNLRSYKAKYNKGVVSKPRDWTIVADFMVFWGIDDNRFWIVPTSEIPKGQGTIMFAQNDPLPYDKTGRWSGGKNYRYEAVMKKKIAYEGRWDLLDLNSTAAPLVESAEVKEKI